MSSTSLATVQLLPPPVVPNTAQCLRNKELMERLHMELLEVNSPKGAIGAVSSSSFSQKMIYTVPFVLQNMRIPLHQQWEILMLFL